MLPAPAAGGSARERLELWPPLVTWHDTQEDCSAHDSRLLLGVQLGGGVRTLLPAQRNHSDYVRVNKLCTSTRTSTRRWCAA